MKSVFSKNNIKKIVDILNCDWEFNRNKFRLTVENNENTRKLVLEIYPDIQIGEDNGNLISVYTENTHLQLHFCTGYVVSEMLEEVTFFSEKNGKVTGLTIEKEAGCSMYSNVDRNVLSGDFANMGPEVMLSGIALSLTEHIMDQSTEK